MKAAAEAHFSDSVVVGKGLGTNLDLLKRLAKKGNKAAIKALKVKIKPPPELDHLMIWYADLRRQAARGFRFEPIQFDQIKAYGELLGLELTSWEVEMLCELDTIWQRVQPEPEANDNRPPRRR